MSYEKNTWASGDVITAEKLNNIENGIEGAGGGTFIVNFDYDYDNETATADKTYAQVDEAFKSGQNVVGKFENSVLPITSTPSENEFRYAFGVVLGTSAGGSIMGFTHFEFAFYRDEPIRFYEGVYDF